MKAKLIILLFASVSLLLGGWIGSAHVKPVQDEEQKAEQIKSESRKEFMRGKLVSNQQVVEGLSMKNFALVREGAQGVTALVKGQHWFVLDTPQYKEFTKDMESSANQLIRAADDKNIEAAALRYFDLTLRCIDCHRYLETVGH